MGQYRTTRNIESSIIDQLKAVLNASFDDISVEKSFARIYGIELPSVCIRAGATDYNKVEISTNAIKRNVLIFIDIFGTSQGQILDIKDCLIDSIKSGFIYYKYTISGGAITAKTADGRIFVLDIADSPVNFDIDRDKLDGHDKFRWNITITVATSKVE